MTLRRCVLALLLATACAPDDGEGMSDPRVLRGQWEGAQPTGNGLDALSVDEDGVGVAELYFVKSGALFVVRLDFEASPNEGWFDCSFTCAADDQGPDDDCLAYEFEVRCSLDGDELRCSPAPEWYPRYTIELFRPND